LKGNAMFKQARGIGLVVFALLLCSPVVPADIYKCVASDGTPTYSQLPCEGNPQKIEIDSPHAEQALAPADCRPAFRFAYQVAEAMQGGVSSSDTLARYGGPVSVSGGAVNLVNFVYGYRASASMTAQRLAGLAQSMCQSGSIRNVSCEDLPDTFIAGMGGCDTDELE
jgi:hypothetical protein